MIVLIKKLKNISIMAGMGGRLIKIAEKIDRANIDLKVFKMRRIYMMLLTLGSKN